MLLSHFFKKIYTDSWIFGKYQSYFLLTCRNWHLICSSSQSYRLGAVCYYPACTKEKSMPRPEWFDLQDTKSHFAYRETEKTTTKVPTPCNPCLAHQEGWHRNKEALDHLRVLCCCSAKATLHQGGLCLRAVFGTMGRTLSPIFQNTEGNDDLSPDEETEDKCGVTL